jgi:hydrogenase expression/formation protein HypE
VAADDMILMGHGSGGRMMHSLIREIIAPAFAMEKLADAAVFDLPPRGRTALTTDSYVVSPLFFPGGDIGELAVCGTVNDLAMMGARPLYLTAGFVLEEGLPLDDLRRVVDSMAATARQAGVAIVTGDTKVGERGQCDGIFINTAGVGTVAAAVDLSPRRIKPGDSILVSGPCGSHGVAVMAGRNGISFDPPLESDAACLNGLVELMLERSEGIRVLRDPTRGGLATTLKEIAGEASRRIVLEEGAVPILPAVRGACDLLGLDPLYVANEGILIAVVERERGEAMVEMMRAHPLAPAAAVIGRVSEEDDGKVILTTAAGGTRMLEMLSGEQLPRIC